MSFHFLLALWASDAWFTEAYIFSHNLITGNYPQPPYTIFLELTTTHIIKDTTSTDIHLNNNVPICVIVVSAVSPSLLWSMTEASLAGIVLSILRQDIQNRNVSF